MVNPEVIVEELQGKLDQARAAWATIRSEGNSPEQTVQAVHRLDEALDPNNDQSEVGPQSLAAQIEGGGFGRPGGK